LAEFIDEIPKKFEQKNTQPSKSWLGSKCLLLLKQVSGFGGRRWSCRDSNPGPEMEWSSFLHV